MKTRNNLKTGTGIFLIVLLMTVLSGCSAGGSQKLTKKVDAVSSPSRIFYEDSSLKKPELLEAIRNAEGGCTVATVNDDNTPNLIVSVPGVADEDHLVFGWAENRTKSNIERDKQAVIAYYIYDKSAAEKGKRNRGARLVCTLEEDEAVIGQLQKENPNLPQTGTFLRIEEVKPLG